MNLFMITPFFLYIIVCFLLTLIYYTPLKTKLISSIRKIRFLEIVLNSYKFKKTYSIFILNTIIKYIIFIGASFLSIIYMCDHNNKIVNTIIALLTLSLFMYIIFVIRSLYKGITGMIIYGIILLYVSLVFASTSYDGKASIYSTFIFSLVLPILYIFFIYHISRNIKSFFYKSMLLMIAFVLQIVFIAAFFGGIYLTYDTTFQLLTSPWEHKSILVYFIGTVVMSIQPFFGNIEDGLIINHSSTISLIPYYELILGVIFMTFIVGFTISMLSKELKK